jgi:hypothetical protein
MAQRRTFASITDTPCTCGYLERAVEDPNTPVVYDRTTGEYCFTWGKPDDDDGVCTLIIFHCPFCGGTAPDSKRHLLFEDISEEERLRLEALLKPIQTIEQARHTLGAPQHDDRTDYLQLIYEQLSEVADVWIIESSDFDRVLWRIAAKQKRPQAQPEGSSPTP